ncbi:MAG: nucleotidyl transferase AbiEii/AbiGii toxin family protein [Cyclobacteriaceae bacterium]
MSYQDFYKLSDKEKLEIFNSTSDKVGIPPVAIEKDWWVVRTLEVIFGMTVAKHLVFKGGTSLSKSWKLIDRFSEDIDLALDKSFLGFDKDKISRTQVGKLRDASFEYISTNFFPKLRERFIQAGLDVTIQLEEVKTTDQDPLIIEIYYRPITPQSEYIQPRVLVEIGSRSLREPFTDCNIQSFIGEHFSTRPFADPPILIPSVNPERTFLEKLFLLHEEFQRPKEKIRVNRLSRHLYDIYRISQSPHAKNAMDDTELFMSIVEHRKTFARLGGVDYKSHYPPNLSSLPPQELRKDWEADYQTMREEMIYGTIPSFDQLIGAIETVLNKVNAIATQ